MKKLKNGFDISLAAVLLIIFFQEISIAQSKLPCQSCHPNEKANWLSGRHSNTQRDLADELALNWSGQRPDSVIHGSAAEDCVACHGPAAVATGAGMSEVQVMAHFFTTTSGLYTNSTTVADTVNWPHVGCVTCHNVSSNHPATAPTLSIFNSATAHYDSLQTTSALCGQCHGTLRFAETDHQIFDAWQASRHGHGGQAHLAGELAASWSGQAPDSVIHGSEAENCIACHAPTAVPQKGSTTEVQVLSRFFTTTSGLFTASTTAADTIHWPEVACNTCHDPHNPAALSYYNSSTKSYAVMTSSDQLCGQCHGSLRFPHTDHRSYDLAIGTGAIGVANKVTMPGAQCVDCHMAKSDIDGTNSKMSKGHNWSTIIEEPDGSLFASCTKCHSTMSAASASAQINKWQAEFFTLDSTAQILVTKADSIACVRNDTSKIHSVDAAKHNLAMAETDESGGFHNHLYSVALLQDAIKRAASIVTGIWKPGYDTQLPTQFALFQNYPNPFNPSTIIRYAVPQSGRVELKIFNLMGQEVATLIDQEQSPGTFECRFDASGLASGMYFYQLRTGSFTATRKLLLLR